MRAYIFLLTAAVLVCRAGVASADENILVGVAANYLVPFNEIAALFEKQSGIKAEPVFASTGKLYVQIIHGAPYDIFLSADEDRPNRLFKDRLAEKPFIYAIGEVVLWSSSRDACRNHKGWIDAVRYSGVRKIALANPETAPYGAAAMSALKAAGLADTLKGKFVFPQDVGQVFQYACPPGPWTSASAPFPPPALLLGKRAAPLSWSRRRKLSRPRVSSSAQKTGLLPGSLPIFSSPRLPSG